MYLNVFTFLVLLTKSEQIWPPKYSVSLEQNFDVYIMEEFKSDDDDFFDAEDEMIKEEAIRRLKIPQDENKYYRLHQLAMRKNQEEQKLDLPGKIFPSKEVYYEEPIPWSAGFVNKDGNFIERGNRNVQYSNAMVNEMKEKDAATEEEQLLGGFTNVHSTGVDYHYDSFKNEYANEIKKAEKSNDTLNITETKVQENAKEALEQIVNFKKPVNCTVEETRGIGLAAAKCFWTDLNKPLSKNEELSLFAKILRYALVWFCLYLIIAVPCWCCCWFRCRSCKPTQTIDEAKKFLLDNPAGIYINANNEKVTFHPTVYEKYTQKKLEQALLKV